MCIFVANLVKCCCLVAKGGFNFMRNVVSLFVYFFFGNLRYYEVVSNFCEILDSTGMLLF